MKKLLKMVSLLLVLFGLMACENPIDPSQGGSNSFLDGGVELSIKKVEGAGACDICRKNISKNEEKYTQFFNINEYRERTVKDYFVNPGDTYEYEIKYYNTTGNNGWKVIESATEVIKKTADIGVGELTSVTTPAATYDSKTGIMTFTTMPKFSALIEQFVDNTTNCEKRFSMSYYLENEGNVLWINNIKESINCSASISEWAQKFAYGKDLRFDELSANIWVDGINYSSSLNSINTTGIPQTINVPDTRSDLPMEATADGIKITFPQGWERAERVTIERYVEVPVIGNNGQPVKGETRLENDQTINTWDLQSKNISEVIDYFVDNGKTYKYMATFRGDNWNDVVLQTKLTSVTANKGGAGELKSTTTPVATYDASTGIMNFSIMPKWPEKVSSLVSKESTVTNWKNYSRFKIIYNHPNRGWVVNEDIKEKTDLFANVWNMEEVKGKELTLFGINTEVKINGIEYSKLLKIEGFPKTVTVVDTRPVITAISNENGIEIKLPAVPEGTERFSIGRQNVKYPTNNGNMKYWYINCSDTKKQSVVDYFVTPGQTYEYTVYYRHDVPGDNGEILKKSKPVQFTAVNGMTESFLDPSTTVTYNENTGIMNLSPVPDTSKIDGLLKEGDSFEPRLWYRLHDNSNSIWGMPDSNGNIDWVSQVGMYGNGKYLGTKLTLQSFQMEANISNVSYRSWYYKDDLKKIVKTIPDSITVPDNRAELKLTPTADGIKITLPEDLKGAESCDIYRRIVGAGSNDRCSMNTRTLSNKEITDYFVDNGVEYEYSANFSKYLGDGKGWETVLQTKTTSVKATGGKGDIKITNNPSATYDPATSVITFSELPKITQSVSEFFIDNNKYRSSLEMRYSIKTSDNNWGNGVDIKIGSAPNVDVMKYVGVWNQEILDKTLTLNFLRFSAVVNDISYYKGFKLDSFNLPKSIIVNDTRVNLKLTPTADGIKISFPEDLRGAENCYFRKRIAGSNDIWESIEISDLKKHTQKEIIDCFVDKNTKYEYTAEFRKYLGNGNGWENVFQSKTSSATAIGGKGDIRFTTEPKLSYKDGIMTLDTKPVLSTSNDGSVGYCNIKYGYCANKNGNGGMLVTDFGFKNDSNTCDLRNVCNKDWYGKDAYFEYVSIELVKDNTRYYKSIKRPFEGIPKVINIPAPKAQ